MTSWTILSEKRLFCAIFITRVTKQVFKITMELDTDILDIASSVVILDIACCDKPVALPNKKI